MLTLFGFSAIRESDRSVKILPRLGFSPDLPARYLALPCSFLPGRLSRFVLPKSFVIQDPPYLFAAPPLRLPPNSNFLHPRSQFHSRLLSLSLLSDLSLFRPLGSKGSLRRRRPQLKVASNTFPGRSDMDSPAPRTLSLSVWEGDPPLPEGSLRKELSQENAQCSSIELAACRLP